ncbi:hypothetical protein [Bradyrhizobium sp.]|uniref:hypothetical protein n=1 Tax=Bradyrhizobium sp. TaxID=376 RepID=UPI001EB6B12B|nr:hypothetical protein [Bradyrhizobium sp.]MBV9980377.1 hypothetical protein [Bradyrhizobium sp.]
MSTHGKISLWAVEFPFASKGLKPPAAGEPASIPPGFRHFLRNPDRSQQFAIDGVPFDPKVEAQRDRADDLMRKLAGAMLFEYPRDPLNPNIPGGYTYLLQLIAHDLVESSLFLSRDQSSPIGLSNVRSKPLRLETIFGGGPIECPHAYEHGVGIFRDRLRLGQVRPDGKRHGGHAGDLRDIARARGTEVHDDPEYPEALIADARNDAHAILSQVVVMFHHFQRKILDEIETYVKAHSAGNPVADAQRKFVATRAACALIFRSIIRNDVLARILHPDVRTAYEAGIPIADPPQGLDNGTWQVPLEFSYGFYRFGHAMIRGKYSFNPKMPPPGGLGIADILVHNSADKPDEMPFEDRWTIDWPRFFANDATNLSVRIGPWSRADLEKAVRGANPQDPGLTVRDLTSSIATQPWSVRALAQALSKTHGKLFQSSRYLGGPLDDPKNPPWLGDVSDWLRHHRPTSGQALSDDDIRILASDPPIPFFARFEAGQDPKIEGKYLGVLTSIVVADVFYGILQKDRLLNIDDDKDLARQLQQVSTLVFDDRSDAFAGLERITTVNSLIDYVGELIRFPTGG